MTSKSIFSRTFLVMILDVPSVALSLTSSNDVDTLVIRIGRRSDGRIDKLRMTWRRLAETKDAYVDDRDLAMRSGEEDISGRAHGMGQLRLSEANCSALAASCTTGDVLVGRGGEEENMQKEGNDDD
mmetsp:Transcript_12972/g.28030  ORF Transcript_12972/g.28030 Transcript_12972/m.28030 type:complete len:127 (-) Transcript_12972:326-706(-)